MNLPRHYRDRRDAGRQLALSLLEHRGRADLLVLALPRGGVPVGYEVARALGAPLDLCLVRKLPTPGQPELALGAVAPGGVRILNPDVVRACALAPEELDAAVEREQAELERRSRLYRGERPAPDVRARTVLLVDDGLATGSTLRAGLEALRRQGARRVIAAVPVGAAQSCAELRRLPAELVCPLAPREFHAVGEFYDDFAQTSDAEVCELLERAGGGVPPS